MLFNNALNVRSSINSVNYSSRVAHPYHLVDGSPWPLLMALALLGFAVTVVSWLTGFPQSLLSLTPILLIALIATLWWRDVIRESKGGFHTAVVVRGLTVGFLLFLVSEIMLFVSFFWAFFNSSLSPATELGGVWPPIGIIAPNAWSLPLLGSGILLSSGFVLTAAHHALLMGNKSIAVLSLFITSLLGVTFVVIQSCEYFFNQFTIADSAYGTTIYMASGLHGLHVIGGTTFLIVCLVRLIRDSFTTEHHVGFEFAAWYWHLVDVVWLALFLVFYWWGGASEIVEATLALSFFGSARNKA